MKNYFKKMSLLLAVSSTIALTSSVGAFAADNYITGISNLNGTAQNSAKVGDELFEPESGWIRFNQDNSNIGYFGEHWYGNAIEDSGYSYLDDNNFAFKEGASLKFKFAGNKIRIISNMAFLNSSNIEISIDGQLEKFSENIDGYNMAGVAFEKLGLEDGEHTVIITNKSNLGLYINAIDINEGGKLLYDSEVIGNSNRVRKEVFELEAGWERFEQDNSNLTYVGKWSNSEAEGFAKTSTYGDSLKFNFVGNKLRVVADIISTNSSNIEISIDGKTETFNESEETLVIGFIPVFEKTDLENGEHTVVITNKSNADLNINAIDINKGGQLKTYSEKDVENLGNTTTSAAVQVTL